MHNFKELKIWQKSMDLTTDIYKLLGSYPENERFGLVSQMRRCAVSISSNIAEGTGRESNKDFRRFLSISLSSSFELETQLIISNNLGFTPDEIFRDMSLKIQELERMIFGFRKTLSKTNKF